MYVSLAKKLGDSVEKYLLMMKDICKKDPKRCVLEWKNANDKKGLLMLDIGNIYTF